MMKVKLPQLPKLYEQDGKGDQAIVYARLKAVRLNWEWYLMESDGQGLFFGLVKGFETELGYISSDDLRVAGAYLDSSFEQCTLGELQKELKKRD